MLMLPLRKKESNLAAKINSIALKDKVDKLDINKLANVLSSVSNKKTLDLVL